MHKHERVAGTGSTHKGHVTSVDIMMKLALYTAKFVFPKDYEAEFCI